MHITLNTAIVVCLQRERTTIFIGQQNNCFVEHNATEYNGFHRKYQNNKSKSMKFNVTNLYVLYGFFIENVYTLIRNQQLAECIN